MFSFLHHDIDFLMLQHYKKHYLDMLSANEGPVVSYTDDQVAIIKIKLTKLDRIDKLAVRRS